MILPDKEKFKVKYSPEFEDFLIRLLEKDPSKRLGSFSAYLDPLEFDDGREVLSHPFFAGLDLEAIEKRTLKAPFMPKFQ